MKLNMGKQEKKEFKANVDALEHALDWWSETCDLMKSYVNKETAKFEELNDNSRWALRMKARLGKVSNLSALKKMKEQIRDGNPTVYSTFEKRMNSFKPVKRDMLL